MDVTDKHFLCTGHVREATDGTLSITAVDDETVRVVHLLYGIGDVRSQLTGGRDLDDVIAGLRSLQHSAREFPVASLRSITWNDYRHDVVFAYEIHNRVKRVTTHINSEEDRNRLIAVLQAHFPRTFRYEDEPAGILRVAWSQLLGALMSVLGTLFVYLNWDPARLARLRHGKIALMFGRNGCALIGLAFFAACCICAWLAIRKRSRFFRCYVRP